MAIPARQVLPDVLFTFSVGDKNIGECDAAGSGKSFSNFIY